MYILKILIRNAFRHKLRTSLTILSITIAILAFGLLRTVVGAWYAGVDASSASRLVCRHAVSLIFGLPLSYKDKIRQIDGVKLVSWGTWFGGIYIDEKNFFANYAVEPQGYQALYPEFIIPPDQSEAFLRDRKAFIAGRKLAARYGWELGDTVTLRGTIYPGNWEFVMRAVYHGKTPHVDETQFIFHWDYLNETIRRTSPDFADQVGWFMIGITQPDRAAEVASAIDKTFKNSRAETLTETEKAFQLSFISMTETILVVIQLVSFIVIAIIIAVVANTMSMTYRERIGEYAIFKTLGYQGWRIAGLIFGESMVITMIGCFFGIVFTFPVAKVFREELGMYFPVFIVTTKTVSLDIAASMVVGLLAAIVPTWRAIQIRIADGLRRIG